MEDPERLRQAYQLVALQHQYDIIDLALYQIRANEEEKRSTNWECLGQTVDQEATAVWPVRPASGGTPKRGPSIFQELHADVPPRCSTSC
jgi:hypothetical protein